MSTPAPIPQGIHRWFLESLDASQQVEGILRNALLDLRQVLASPILDPGMRPELERLLRLLEGAVGRMTELQRAASGALIAIRNEDGGAAGSAQPEQNGPSAGEAPQPPRGSTPDSR